MGDYRRAQPYQKVMHIPKTGKICAKDCLARMMKQMKQLYGNIYNFTPLTFIMPNEYRQFINYYHKDGNEKCLWICKPTDGARGGGISIISHMDDLKYER